MPHPHRTTRKLHGTPLPGAVCAALTALLLVTGCGKEGAAKPRDVPVPVIAETAATQPVSDAVETVGRVEPEVRSDVGTILPGRIVLMTRDVGDLIPGACGDPGKDDRALLAKLDTSTLEAQAKRLDAEVKLAEANKTLADKEWKRAEDLFGQKVIPPSKLDEAKAGAEAAAARVEAVKAARAEVAVQIEQSSIYAPMDAVVIQRFANVGDVLNPAFTPKLYRLECIRDLKVNAVVPERDVPDVKARKDAAITFDALPGRTFSGSIHALIPSGDPVSHSFTAEIRFRNHTKDGPLPAVLPENLTPDDLLIKPGMFARVRITKYRKDAATVVPKRCVVEEGDKAFVYRIIDGVARKTPVEVGIASGLMIEILGGLEHGRQVVGRGIENVTEGQRVRVIGEKK